MINIQDDREFEALSEYLFTFEIRSYESDENSKIPSEKTVKKPRRWEWIDEGVLVKTHLSFFNPSTN